MSHELSADAINLEEGRLTARPAPDVYLYNFLCDTALLPEIGQRGRFFRSQEAEALEARVTNREGPRLSLSIVSDESLPVNISGHFEAAAPPPAPELSLDEALKTPPGIRQFLDQRDGWVMELTEAASQKQAAAGDGQWPAVSLSDLNRSLSPGGFTFIWRQSPDSGTGVSAMMAEHLSGFGRVLVLGESPADLEELAELPEALFLGPAPPGTPLHPISVHTRTAEAVQAKDMAQAELRNQLSDLKRAGLSLKSEMDRWADLDELEKRFKEMGQEVARRRRRWGETRQSLSLARKAWEEADALVNKNARGLLERLRNKGPDETALRVEGERRKALDEAEERVAQVRHEEENILEKVLAQERILSDARLDSQSWNSREDIERRLADLGEEEKSLTARGMAIAARPIISHPEMLQAAPLVLALLSDAAPGEILAGRRFASVMVLASSPPDHQGRLRLASLAALAEEQFVMMGDFTFWPVWKAKAPPLEDRPDAPAWSSMMLAEEADDFKKYMASGGPFAAGSLSPLCPRLARLEPGREFADLAAMDFKYIVEPAGTNAADGACLPIPEGGAAMRRRKKVTSSVTSFGIGFRAFGEIGPANPVSALLAARAAVNAAREISAGGQADGPAVIVLCASPAQSRLVTQMLKDLEAPKGLVYSGEPQDFRHWPQVPLVILEPAFEAPHTSHPWAWPAFGRQRLSLAFKLAGERIWAAGREPWMRSLPEAAPLSVLWRLAGSPALEANRDDPRPGLRVINFWEALDKAKKEVWAIVPTFESFWWRPLEEHFLAAMRRRVQVTILSSPPGPDQDREYPSAAIRTLAAYGCSIHLAAGLPGFMAVVDSRHFTWGHFIKGSSGVHIWGGLRSAELPLAAPEMGRILQIKTITEKLGRKSGGLKNCRICGWPLVLINEEYMRGYGDEQPLKVGCLGEHGGNFPRRLDEREPFFTPPKCREDHNTHYQRRGKGRAAVWVCPNHPDGPCPTYKTVPGDPQ